MLFLPRMKKIFSLFIISVLLFSCSNELDITADYKETTIIYGLLNQTDSVQYVQVFKGFLDDNTSALILAQNPDSVFYNDSVEVKLNDGSQTYSLDRIIGPNRAAGVFVDSPNYVYRLPSSVVEDRNYNLTFTNLRTGHVVTAQSPVVKDFDINFPPEELLVNFAVTTPVNVQWRSAENGKIYQLDIRFFYEEWNVNNPSDKDTFYVDWPIFNQQYSNTTAGGESMSFKIDGLAFYSFLKSRLEENPDLQRQTLEYPLEFRFFVGAEELYNYIRVNSAQSGITALSVKPEYTNVNGGLGIFSSRYNKSRINIGLAQRSLDSLSCGSFTKNLNFVDSDLCN